MAVETYYCKTHRTTVSAEKLDNGRTRYRVSGSIVQGRTHRCILHRLHPLREIKPGDTWYNAATGRNATNAACNIERTGGAE